METLHKPQIVDGMRIQVQETAWVHGRTFSVYRLALDPGRRGRRLLKPRDSFDHYPTDDEIRELVRNSKQARTAPTVQQNVADQLGPHLGLRERDRILAIVGDLEAKLAEATASNAQSLSIYMVTLDDYIDADDPERGPFTAGAVVIADNPTHAAGLIATEMSDEAWEAAEVRQVGTASPGEKPIVVVIDLT